MIYKDFDLYQTIPGARNFYWQEALFLPSWGIYCFPTHEEARQIRAIAIQLQKIREHFGKPISVTNWLRPRIYNQYIGGRQFSWHMTGGAVDFRVMGMGCDIVRQELESELENLGIRMENLPGSDWVHIDNRDPNGGNRFFKP